MLQSKPIIDRLQLIILGGGFMFGNSCIYFIAVDFDLSNLTTYVQAFFIANKNRTKLYSHYS